MEETESWEILVSLSANEISLAEAHDQILRLFNVVRQSEQFYCWESGEAGVKNPLCDKQCDHCAKLYPKQ